MLLRYVILFLLNVLVAASIIPILGWDPKRQHGPKIGGVYFIEYASTGENLAYRPFVVIRPVRLPSEKMYFVVRISDSRVLAEALFPTSTIRFASDFFGKNVMLKMATETVNLNDYYVFPGEMYEVKGTPDFMRRWPGSTVTTMSEEGLDRLMAASDRMVDGWTATSPGPLPGVTYWLLPRDVGFEHGPRAYIPCVFIGWDGYKCLVVCMYQVPDEGVPAWQFFGSGVMLPTPFGIVNLDTYRLFPSESHKVEANPKIMQLWDWHVTQMRENKVKELANMEKEKKKEKKKALSQHVMRRSHRRELGF